MYRINPIYPSDTSIPSFFWGNIYYYYYIFFILGAKKGAVSVFPSVCLLLTVGWDGARRAWKILPGEKRDGRGLASSIRCANDRISMQRK